MSEQVLVLDINLYVLEVLISGHRLTLHATLVESFTFLLTLAWKLTGASNCPSPKSFFRFCSVSESTTTLDGTL